MPINSHSKSNQSPSINSTILNQPALQATDFNDYQISFPNISSNYASTNTTTYYSEDANKAFDDVVFDILKVDPDHIAGQLTLIDLPLFKLIEPDELISCKWMSREKLIKAPNIVQFTRRFNQTAFWCQKEILNCKRIETRGKMLTHFIKIAKRLNELHSFNSLMAIIVALKSAPIYRLKKTWSQHVSKRDLSYFERMADIMFDTSDNKAKIRDMHMNCKLPCIPFLGLFLTDLIHIDIAHPHNAFDNPQRRNQMNNICRLISDKQQSNYQDLTSLSCSCCFGTNQSNQINSDDFTSNCITQNCNCDIHHGHGYGGGIINNDGTIYISEISYVKNYLNSFLYIEELQKFKEDDNYRESLELEPDPINENKSSESDINKFTTSSPSKPNINCLKQTDTSLINETKDLINDLKLKHPLDDSIVDRNGNGTASSAVTSQPNSNTSNLQSQHLNNLTNSKTNLDDLKMKTDPSLLKIVLKQRHQIQSTHSSNLKLNEEHKSHHYQSLKNKFNCYSSNTTDIEDDDVNNVNNDSIDNQEISFNADKQQTPIKLFNLSFDSATGPFTNSSQRNNSDKTNRKNSVCVDNRRLSGRNLIKSLNEEKFEDKIDGPATITPNLSNSDLFPSSIINDQDGNKNNTDLSSLSSIFGGYEQQHLKLVLFESPVKRKCIIKNFRKPRFSQWKPYWLQLIGGNLLVYYPTKSVISFNGLSNNQRRNSTTSNHSYFIADQFQLDQEVKSDIVSIKSDKNQIQSQLQHQKVLFNKNPCKMHPIASWMVVNLYQDKENELLAQSTNINNAQISTLNSSLNKCNKFDIQLNDLNNGNMYKYRFESLQLAKEWFEQFRLASTFHERQKPDNLIKFD